MMSNPDNQRPDKRSSTVFTGKRARVMWEDINSIYLDKLCGVMIQYEHFITQDNLRRVQGRLCCGVGCKVVQGYSPSIL